MPSTKTTYQKLVDKIFEVCPELEREVKELKRNCRLVYEEKEEWGEIKEHLFILNDEYRLFPFNDNCNDWFDYNGFSLERMIDRDFCKDYVKEYGLKIIGRDLGLEDVLRALNKDNNGWNFAVNQGGGFIKYRNENGWEIIEYSFGWLLGKPLSDQSEKTLKALFEMLG